MRSWPRRAVLAAAVLAASLVAPDGASAQERRDQLQDQLLEATATEARLAGELEAIDARRTELAGELADLEARVAVAQRALDDAEAAEAEATARAADAESELRRASARLADAVGLLREQAVSAFMTGGSTATLNEMLEVDDIRALEQARTYTEVVVERQDAVVDDVARLRDRVAELAEAAETARDTASEAAAGAEVRRDGLRAERDRAAALRLEADSAAQRRTELLAFVQVQKAVVEAELAAMEALSSSIAAYLASGQAGQVATAATRGTLTVPVPSARMSSPFGPRTHPLYGDVRLHKGVDLAAPDGTPIVAAADGVVVSAGPQGGYGLAVVIDHGAALATLYAHQSRLAVVAGQRVRAGEVIGAVGSTGNSTGNHVHFEVRRSGAPVDPLAYL